ncbi:hypothetical protein IMG5_059970 [Ichthyophthirius multifiliis]|uniref:Uncharacterized protein n=1 Tax=Ichthyophthirius multifiliis TaxID=5932 RepID=G0QNM2_ICHMU|nr:hypothetical protein IMG5_059970 [Ichthyophthirius multifiliis]EGR33183.1 hypothetical protein IMG5_059970 [Ichthyophthirius multifiliis]|eukprot:XP_004037169.1 hypothetical protein IMG5_059970 [Ichthyophthirius multifiliis]
MRPQTSLPNQSQPQPQQTIPTPNSLVKYASAVLVSTGGKQINEKSKQYTNNVTNHQTEAILNSILPPREYIMNKKQLWIQKVSATPATKSDVLELVNNLDKRLQQRSAKQCGQCPIREELYAQCFDELIRQITINCSERGLLLLRIRDEIKYTIQAYQTLYESATAYGMRKYLIADTRKSDMDIYVKQLDQQCTYEGCDCTSAFNLLYKGNLYKGECTKQMIQANCKKIASIPEKIFNFWNIDSDLFSLCTDRSSVNYLTQDCSNINFKECEGLQPFCVPKEEICPINSVKFGQEILEKNSFVDEKPKNTISRNSG